MSASRLGPHEYANPQLKMAAIQKYGRKHAPVAKVAPAQQTGNGAAEQISRNCAVLGCDDWKTQPHDCFFRFPDEPSLRQVWTEMTGRVNWIPNDFSYVCVEHFTKDCVNARDDAPVLEKGSVPTLKLPGHVMEVEYIDEEILDREEIIPRNIKESECDITAPTELPIKPLSPQQPSKEAQKEEQIKTELKPKPEVIKPKPDVPKSKEQLKLKPELLKLFSEVQIKQKQIVSLSKRLRHDKLMLHHHQRTVYKLKEQVKGKELLLAKRKPKVIEDELTKSDKDSALLMPTKYTDEAKNFALSVYKYSPEAYIYLRNTLRTMLPTTDILNEWVKKGFEPKNVMSVGDAIKVVTETNDKELLCRVVIEQ